MAEYFDKNLAWHYIKLAMPLSERENLKKAFDKIPTADVQGIKHGKWMQAFSYIFKWKSKSNSEKGFHAATCSNCKITQSVMTYQGKIKYNYCPYCGAKMDGK